jgi:hypothetical protein
MSKKSFTLDFDKGKPLDSLDSNDESFEGVYIVYGKKKLNASVPIYDDPIPLYIGYTTIGLFEIARHDDYKGWQAFATNFDLELYVTIAECNDYLNIELVKHCLIWWCFNEIMGYWPVFNQSAKKDFDMQGYHKIDINITGRARDWYDNGFSIED